MTMHVAAHPAAGGDVAERQLAKAAEILGSILNSSSYR
jgi:hypothetical protein